MKLVLLPGMDGTGKLFQSFLQHCKYQCQIIKLPEQGDQTHLDLARKISHQLPDENYIILAESFSGGLIPHLLFLASRKPSAIIFAASFLANPRPLLAKIFYYLPMGFLMRFASTRRFIYWLCLRGSTQSELNLLIDILSNIDMRIIRKRMNALQKMTPTVINQSLPILCITPTKDKLIPKSVSQQISINAEYKFVDGPHFIMQARPREAFDIIEEFVIRHQLNS